MLLAFSQRMLKAQQSLVFITGVQGRPLDTLGVMQVGEESELFQTVDQPELTEHIRRIVFRRVLTLSLELAAEGREGKPVGALFVIGDDKEVLRLSDQNILNPVAGYPEKQRNILDERMAQTIKEFSTIDGAFVVRGNGVIVSAGTTLRPILSGQPLPQGLGARHAAAAAITASTQSIAITLSESDGTVRVWRRGEMITEIEKSRAPA
jgi:DNA integrity scanning protein DisA with diadenylate cyclase activity